MINNATNYQITKLTKANRQRELRQWRGAGRWWGAGVGCEGVGCRLLLRVNIRCIMRIIRAYYVWQRHMRALGNYSYVQTRQRPKLWLKEWPQLWLQLWREQRAKRRNCEVKPKPKLNLMQSHGWAFKCGQQAERETSQKRSVAKSSAISARCQLHKHWRRGGTGRHLP